MASSSDLSVIKQNHSSDTTTCRQYMFFLGFFSKLLHRQSPYTAKLRNNGIMVTVPLPFLTAAWKELLGRDVKTCYRSIVHNFPATSKEDPIYKGTTFKVDGDVVSLTVNIVKEIMNSNEVARVRTSTDSRVVVHFAWKLFSTVRPYNEEHVYPIRDVTSRTRIFSNIDSCISAVSRLANDWGFSRHAIVEQYLEKASAPYRKDVGIYGFGPILSDAARIKARALLPFPALDDDHSDGFDYYIDGFVVDVQAQEQAQNEEFVTSDEKHDLPVHKRTSTNESIFPIPEETFRDLVQPCRTNNFNSCFNPKLYPTAQTPLRLDTDSETDEE